MKNDATVYDMAQYYFANKEELNNSGLNYFQQVDQIINLYYPNISQERKNELSGLVQLHIINHPPEVVRERLRRAGIE